jgi:hypothetical protein
LKDESDVVFLEVDMAENMAKKIWIEMWLRKCVS